MAPKRMKVRELHDNSAIQLNPHAARPCSSTLNFSDMPESREALDVLGRQKGAGKVKGGALREGARSQIFMASWTCSKMEGTGNSRVLKV